MRYYLLIGILFGFINANCQTISIEKRHVVDDFHQYSLRDAIITKNGYTILGLKSDKDYYKSSYYITTLDTTFNVISQERLSDDRDTVCYYQSLINTGTSNHIVLGTLDTGDGYIMDNYIACFDKSFNKKWKLILSKTYEGNIKGFIKNNCIYVVTNDDKSYKIHIISKEGILLETKTIEVGFAEYLHDIILYDDYFILYGWHLEKESSYFDLIKLDYDCKVINSHYQKITNTPKSINKLDDGNIALIFESVPSTISFFDSNLNEIKKTTHIRHDCLYGKVARISEDKLLYIDTNHDKLRAFVVHHTDVLSKIQICNCSNEKISSCNYR